MENKIVVESKSNQQTDAESQQWQPKCTENRAQWGGGIWEKEDKLLGKYYRLKWTFKISISKVICAKYIHHAQDYDYLYKPVYNLLTNPYSSGLFFSYNKSTYMI